MKISLAPEILFSLGGIQLTNSLFTGIIIFFLIILIFSLISLNFKFTNPSKFQIIFEMMLVGMQNLGISILGEKRGKSLFGFIFTFFIFILVSNLFGLLPFVPTTVVGKLQADTTKVVATKVVATKVVLAAQTYSPQNNNDVLSLDTNQSKKIDISLGNCLSTRECYITTNGIQKFSEEKHLFRAPTSDLSFTIAFALIAVISVNILGFKTLKQDYLKKYINFTSPINAFVGILELVSEFGKLISFSFRLFGNVFAGEILLAVITSITYGIVTLPFLGLELFVGVIQALVFFMLTAALISLATTPHGGHSTELTELPLSP